MIRLYKYSCNERRYLMVDGRGAEVTRFCREDSSHALCLVHGVDMIAVLKESICADFALECHGFGAVERSVRSLLRQFCHARQDVPSPLLTFLA